MRFIRAMRFPALVTLLVFAIGTIAAWRMDDAVRAWFRGPGIGGAPVAHQLRAPLEGVVEAQLYIVVPGILIALPNRRRLLIGWGVAMLLMLAMTHGTKFAVGRARPHMNQSPETFEPWIADSRMKSFPSGHTSAAIAGAVLLGLYFPRGALLFYAIGALIGIDRIRVEAHYLSDVVAGAGIGVLAVVLARRWLGAVYFDAQAPAEDRPAPPAPESS